MHYERWVCRQRKCNAYELRWKHRCWIMVSVSCHIVEKVSVCAFWLFTMLLSFFPDIHYFYRYSLFRQINDFNWPYCSNSAPPCAPQQNLDCGMISYCISYSSILQSWCLLPYVLFFTSQLWMCTCGVATHGSFGWPARSVAAATRTKYQQKIYRTSTVVMVKETKQKGCELCVMVIGIFNHLSMFILEWQYLFNELQWFISVVPIVSTVGNEILKTTLIVTKYYK